MSERSPAAGRAWSLGIAGLARRAALCVAAASVVCGSAEASSHRHHGHGSRAHSVRLSHAGHVSRNSRWQPTHRIFQLTAPEKDAALVLDGETGKMLYARNVDALRHPASLTKMMTLYLLFEQLKNGQMTLATPIRVSTHAASQGPTKLYARPGTAIPVDDAIKSVVVLSANDIAVAIAESIGGTESHFAEMMTAKARSWGMTHTFFHNASGLPDDLQITSAGDLGILARHLAYDFPQYFHYFSTYSFTWRGATHYTHDNLIGRYDGADGIKTGYTGASGFNLVSSVVRNGVHIIGVVMGGTTARRRDTEMVRLLDDTFAAIGKNPLLVARAPIPWQTLAQNASAQPVIAGFQFGTGNAMPPPMIPIAAEPLRSSIARPGSEDEEAAESSPDPAYETTAVTAKPVQPPPAAAKIVTLSPPPTKIATLSPPPTKIVTLSPPPTQKGATVASAPAAKKITVVSLENVPLSPPVTTPAATVSDSPALPVERAPKPQPKPSVPALVVSPELDTVAPLIGTNWTVQIGAYGDATLAQSELAAYAQKSADVLGQAARIVSPFESPGGHVIYRARFGPFEEGRARQVCQVLTQRGQNCFAAIASR